MTLPFGRRTEAGAAPHDRARQLGSDRLSGPIDGADATWLDAHLRGCPACRTAIEGYAADRLELRSSGRQAPAPPRDLWARTSGAIERERRPRRSPVLRRVRPSPVPLGVVSGMLVVAVVIGATLLSGQPVPNGLPSRTAGVALASPAAATDGQPTPAVTPLTVAADVAWLAYGGDGDVELHRTRVHEVCADDATACAPIQEAPTPGSFDLPDVPRTAIVSPDDEQIVVLESDDDRLGGGIVVVPVPTEDAPPTASPTRDASPTSAPPASPADSPAMTPSDAAASPSLAASPPPATDPPSSEPSATPASTAPSGTASASPAVTGPPPATPSGAATASPPPTPSALPSESPAPIPGDGPQDIAAGLIVVGDTAEFSPDGEWFAFSARAMDGSAGPDIYAWSGGTEAAVALTTDHRSMFSGWLDGRILGSRAAAPVDGEAASAESPATAGAPATDPSRATAYRPEVFLLDPATGAATVVESAAVWRPSVDPTLRRAVYWDGSVRLSDDGTGWEPADGRLVVADWTGPVAEPTGDAPALVGPSSEPAAARPSEAPEVEGPVDVLSEEPIRDWDARWDEDGTHLAVWIAHADDPSIGYLSLYTVDPRTGRLDLDSSPLRDQVALPGFAIRDGQIAWATPPGQDGKGSHVQLLAWTDDGFGKVETAPGDDQVVVVR